MNLGPKVVLRNTGDGFANASSGLFSLKLNKFSSIHKHLLEHLGSSAKPLRLLQLRHFFPKAFVSVDNTSLAKVDLVQHFTSSN